MQRTLLLSMVLAFVAAASAFAPAALPALRSSALRGPCRPPSPTFTFSTPYREGGRRAGPSLAVRAGAWTRTSVRARAAALAALTHGPGTARSTNLKMQQDPQQTSGKRVGASIDADGLSLYLHSLSE